MNEKKIHEHYVSTTQAAELLGVSRISVFKKIKTGVISAERVGRNYLISVDEMNRLLGKRGPLSDKEKIRIDRAVERAVKQYGTALKMLGKE